jgi:hypothetical protein
MPPERELVRQRDHFHRHLQHLRGLRCPKRAGRYDTTLTVGFAFLPQH